MPTYDYQCRSCGFITEVVHSMLEDGPSECERCAGQLRRVVHPTGIIFKGSGFYKTDSRPSSSGSAAGGNRESPAAPGGGATTSKPADGGSSEKGSAPTSSSGGSGGSGGAGGAGND